jgi:NADH-quinone oxidoreductase subunit G
VSLIGGDSIEAAFKEVREGRAETVVIVENDVFRRCGSETAEGLLESAKHVIVIDHIVNACAQRAHLILPAATFAEGQGTFVSNEGRAQRFFRVFQPAGEIRESWRWLRDLTVELKRPEAHQLATFDAIVSLMAAALPVFKDVPNSTPNADWRGLGQEIPRQAHRFSGRTAILANVTVHEPAPPQDTDSPLAFSMEGFQGVPPSALISRFWAPGWNSVQALNKFQSEVGGPLIGGDPGKRLIEPSAHGEIAHFTGVPAAFQRRPGQWLVVAVHHIFGSEELSLLSPGIAELAPRPYLGLNPRDAEALGIREGDLINVRVEKRALDLPARLDPSLPGGFASLPVGMPGLEGIGLPAWGTVIGISKGTDT